MSLRETAERWAREWREEGRLEGLEEGRRQGAARLLTHLLYLKFGTLSPDVYEGIQEADAEFLLIHWGIRLLTAQTREEIFGDYPSPDEDQEEEEDEEEN